MNKNSIILGLQCCAEPIEQACERCPYFNERIDKQGYYIVNCMSHLAKDALTLIQTDIICCKDCKWRGKVLRDGSIKWPDDSYKCPGRVDDPYYDWLPKDNFYCANGELKENE